MKTFSDYTSITLSGNLLNGEEIVHFCNNQNDDFLKKIGEFIEEWLNPNPLISLKTSGSTGIPKTILVEKNKMLLSAARTAGYFGFKSGQKALLCLPVNYIAGKMMVVRAFFSGLNLICVTPSQHPLEHLPSGMVIDFAAMIPLQLQQAIHHPALPQIKRILLGGGPVGLDLEKQLKSVKTEIFHGYGMTETLSHIALRHVNGKKHSLSYKALNGIQLALDDRHCLTITANGLSEKTLITNDLVAFTGENEFIWKGRYDNIINSGGIKLFPEEIEEKLYDIINRRYYLTGIDDEKWGKKLILIIEGIPLIKDEMNALEKQIESSLNPYEIPKEIYFVDNFIETENRKVNRMKTTSIAISGVN